MQVIHHKTCFSVGRAFFGVLIHTGLDLHHFDFPLCFGAMNIHPPKCAPVDQTISGTCGETKVWIYLSTSDTQPLDYCKQSWQDHLQNDSILNSSFMQMNKQSMMLPGLCFTWRSKRFLTEVRWSPDASHLKGLQRVWIWDRVSDWPNSFDLHGRKKRSAEERAVWLHKVDLSLWGRDSPHRCPMFGFI